MTALTRGGGSTARTPTVAESLPSVAWALQERDAKGTDSSTKEGHLIAVRQGGFFDDAVSPITTRPYGDNLSQEDKLIVSPEVTHALTSAGHDASEDGTGRGPPIAVVPFDTTQITSKSNYSSPKEGDPSHPLASGAHPPCIAFPERMSSTQRATTENLAPAMGSVNQTAVAFSVDTLPKQGMIQNHASTQKADTVALLLRLRKEVGEKAFTEWGLGVSDSLRSTIVLRQTLHGEELRQTLKGWIILGDNPPSRSEDGSCWSVYRLWEAFCEGCTPQGWKPSEQLAGELAANLSQLSQPDSQAACLLHGLREASEGIGILQQALSSIQEVRRPEPNKISYAVRRLTPRECERLMGLPDDFTRYGVDAKGRRYELSDSARYRCLGNAVAVPNVEWILKRVRDVYEKGAVRK